MLQQVVVQVVHPTFHLSLKKKKPFVYREKKIRANECATNLLSEGESGGKKRGCFYTALRVCKLDSHW